MDTMDPFWFKFFLVIFLMILQGFLWAWVGMQAKQHIKWWPFREDAGLLSQQDEKKN